MSLHVLKARPPRWLGLRRRSVLVVAFGVVGGVAALSVLTPASWARSDAPAAQQLNFVSPLGSYLAARIANSTNDIGVAAELYARSLTVEPDNRAVLESAFEADASEGKFQAAAASAAKLIELEPGHRLANLVLGVVAFQRGSYTAADDHFRRSAVGPIAEVTGQLARAWVARASRKTNRALELLRQEQPAAWAKYYTDYHRGLIAERSGQLQAAWRDLRGVVQRDPRSTRALAAYATAVAARGETERAKTILRRQIARAAGYAHPIVEALLDDLSAAKTIKPLIETTSDGLAEVFYGLGEALATEGGVRPLGLVYLQLALALRPGDPYALAALASAYETLELYGRANATYDLIAVDTPLASAIEIRRAMNLNAVDRIDEARALLEARLQRNPDDLEAIEALATMLRGRKLYADAIPYFTRAIEKIGTPEPRHWTYFYARGTCYERIKDWPRAEADLLKALELNENQPLILNYLGYSWVDQNRRLDEGLEMIKRAVELKPNDGYIVDSLGWAYFRLGDIEKAVQYLEQAVELQPEDPILNDHLGDALWKAGREREARYQWQLALTFKPEPEEVIKIQRKLAEGLAAEPLTRKAETATPAPANP
ncbi:MAG: tetratricopeptide repeat protein [Hyphomicrobiaceae bacterium]